MRPASPGFASSRETMRTYYFDMREGIPIRDRKGLEFPNVAGAIAHSKEMARQLRDDPRVSGRAISIAVIDESGTEVHRETVQPRTTERD
jgi:hypothetical protein